jgi:RNA polymerase sigma factor (sigma-70 family)
MASDTALRLSEYLHRLSSAQAADALSDRQLVERFALKRDEEAFATLVRRHGPMVLGVCRRVLNDAHAAEDAFQAVFLVLSRKAGSLRCADSVGCWLYGVAYRVAHKARVRRARQRQREGRAARGEASTGPLAELTVREAQEILDEEMARLPEKYRAPLILCCFEGRTRDEAARQLGWPARLVKSRLEDGRRRLRSRLARRGLALPAALGAALLAEGVAPAALPAGLLGAAVRSVLSRPAVEVASLAEGAMAGTAGAKAKAALGLLLLTGVLAAGVGALGPRPPAAGPPRAKASVPVADEVQRPGRADRLGDPLPAGAIARIGSLHRWGAQYRNLLYTPGGKGLALADDQGAVRILDVTSGKERLRLAASPQLRASCFALSPDGKAAATAYFESPRIHVWDLYTGKDLRSWKAGVHPVSALAFSPDGTVFVAGVEHEGMRLWQTAAWKEVGLLPAKDMGYVDDVFFLPDGKTLISEDNDGVPWWDVVVGRQVRLIRPLAVLPPTSFSHLAVSPDGTRVAALQDVPNSVLLIWEGATGKELRRIRLGDEVAACCLCFSPDSRTLACGTKKKRGSQIVFFAAATGEKLRHWDEDDNDSEELAYAPDGKVLAQATRHSLRFRDVATGKTVAPEVGLPEGGLAVRFSRDGSRLIGGCCRGQTGAWAPLSGKPLTPLRDPPEGFGRPQDVNIWPQAMTADGERAALVNSGSVVHVWEPATGRLCCRIAEPPAALGDVCLSADGKLLAARHKDEVIRLWDASTGAFLRSLPQTRQQHYLHPQGFSPDGRILAVASDIHESGVVLLIETATAKAQGRLTLQDDSHVSALAFSPDGKYLLMVHDKVQGGKNEMGGVRLWDWQSGRELRRYRAPCWGVRAVAFSPDGKSAAAAVDHAIVLWESASGVERGRFNGHQDWIRSLAFSADGRLLASGSWDSTACVWDVTGICPDGQWPPHQGAGNDLERLWGDLGHKDGMRAYRALWRLAAAGPAAATFLARRLRPVPPVAEGQLSRLIADLDSDQYETRQRASAELSRLGERVEPALRKALAGKPTLEAARRLRTLLDRVERGECSAEQLHALRAVEVLEHIGSSEARAVLRSLSAGAPGAILTREAGATLERLSRRSSAKP